MDSAKATTRSANDRPDGENPSAGQTRFRVRFLGAPLNRTMVMALATIAMLLPAHVTYLAGVHAPSSPHVHWWLIALAFAVAEKLVFYVEVRREAIGFTLAELPLTMALFFCSPTELLVGRLVGAALVLIYERHLVRKIVVNLANFAAECTVAMTVFHALRGSHDLRHPIAWVSAVVAVAVADTVTLGLVTLAMRWHGAPSATRQMIVTNAATIVGNTGLAISAAILISTNPWAVVPFAVLIVLVVTAYRGYSTLVQRYASLEQLYEFTRLVSGSQRPETVLKAILRDARRLLRADLAAIVLQPDDSTDTVGRWFHADSERTMNAISIGDLASYTTDRTALVIARDPRDRQHRELLKQLGLKDCVLAPVFEGSRLIGMMIAGDRETEVSTFGAEDGRIFATIANHASIALENGRLIERLHDQAAQHEHESLHDPLTGLPNRARFLRDVAQAIASANGTAEKFGVALLDLNDFKQVNDTLGHYHGDVLLAEVAARLVTMLPNDLLVARLGGDEFALLTPFGASFDSLRELGTLVERAFAKTFQVEDITLEVATSVGFALFPDHATDATTLMQRADVAMYEAKTSTSSRVEIYDANRDHNTPRRLAFATDLRAALSANEIKLNYQPKASMADGLIVGAEALARWIHPEHGFVPPDEFIALAERTGLIKTLTQNVLIQGFDQLEQWNADGIDIGMSLNLSMRNLIDPELPAMVSRLLSRRAIRPSAVTFEVTETMMMTEPTTVSRILHELADLGTKISIDDFGTGHSSLSHLRQLPVHELKIDKSIVFPLTSDPNAAVIVRSIIDLANNLGISVVAEGIEDQATWDALFEMGCHLAQGYHLSRPAPAAAMEQWLRERQPTPTSGNTKRQNAATPLR